MQKRVETKNILLFNFTGAFKCKCHDGNLVLCSQIFTNHARMFLLYKILFCVFVFFTQKRILESKHLLLQIIWSPEVIWILFSINKECHKHKTWHQNLFFVCVFIWTKNITSEPREWQHELHWVLVRTCRWEILQKNRFLTDFFQINRWWMQH